MHIKPEGMTQFAVFHTFVENSGKLEFLVFFELYSKEPESEIHRKMPIFEQLKNQILVNSKPFLTPH